MRDGEGENFPYRLNRELRFVDFDGLAVNWTGDLASGVSSSSPFIGDEFSPPEEKSMSTVLRGVVKDGARKGDARGAGAGDGTLLKKKGRPFGGPNDGSSCFVGEPNCACEPARCSVEGIH